MALHMSVLVAAAHHHALQAFDGDEAATRRFDVREFCDGFRANVVLPATTPQWETYDDLLATISGLLCG